MNRESEYENSFFNECEDLYRFMFQANPHPMWICDLDSLRFLAVNDAAIVHYGYSKVEFLAMTIADIRPAEDVPRLFEKFNNLSVDQIHFAGIWRHKKKDGSLIDVEITKHSILFQGQRAEVVLAHDVTERIRAELFLHRESQKYLTLLHNASDGIHIVDMSYRLIEASNSFCAMLGYTREEMIGMHVSQWDAKFNEIEVENLVKECYLKKGRCQFETLHRRKDGTLLDVEVSGVSLELEGQRVLFNSSRDITERKQAEQKQRIAATAFESQEGILICDADNIILQVNKAFTKITGYSLDEVMGKTPRILKSGRHSQDFYSAMWGRLNTTGTWEGEIWNKNKLGEIYPEYLAISAVKDSHDIVTHYVGTITDITQKKAAAEEIERLAFYDPLTGIPNRRLLYDRLIPALESSNRNGRQGALLFIDLDNFKTLNDTLGHDMGDLLLKQVAQRIQECIRACDTIARVGGDEFVLLLEDLSEQALEAATQAECVGEKILGLFKRHFKIVDQEYTTTASIGVTLFCGHKQSIEELLKHADIAMYHAKTSGRNALRFFDPQMQWVINQRLELECGLRNAIADEQFQLYYQLQVDDSGSPLGAEVLIRWIHPEKGVISPLEFIPLAEETGLILPIGQWVLETACSKLNDWQKNPSTCNLVLSVNVSAKQFFQANFVKQVIDTAQRYEVDLNLLNLELTESILIEDIENTIQTMLLLGKVGIKFSLDDFGTGYSSLQYLKKLPLDQLKIDQSFIRDFAFDSGDQAIVCTIIAMANILNLSVIAEGVETEEQRRLLQLKGCTYYQGYLFSKPVPIEQFEALLKRPGFI